MLSKQVKDRIRLNKYRHRCPKWIQELNWHFSREMGVLQQRRLSSKHLVVNAAHAIAEIDRQMDALLKDNERAQFFTRQEWRQYEADFRAKREAEWAVLRQIARSSQYDRQTLGRGLRPTMDVQLRDGTPAKLHLTPDPEQLEKDFEGDLLNALPSCECGKTIGEYNLGVGCTSCGTEVRRRTESNEVVVSPSGGGLVTIGGKRFFVASKLSDEARPETEEQGEQSPLPFRKHVFGSQPSFSYRPSKEVLKVRSIDTDLTGEELVEAVIKQRARRLHQDNPSREEAVAEIARRGEKQVNEMLRQERIRDRTRFYGDPWNDLRIVTQATSDEYYDNVLRRPVVRDSQGEREMTEMEWQTWKLSKIALDNGAVEWQPGFAQTTPKKQGEQDD